MNAISPSLPTQPAAAGSPPPPGPAAQERRDVERTETARPVTAPESGQRTNAEDRDREVSAGRSEPPPGREARAERAAEAERDASVSEERAAQNDRTVSEQRAEARNDRSQRGQTVDLFA